MKPILLSTFVALMFACDSPVKKARKPDKFYYSVTQRGRQEPNLEGTILRHDAEDTLVASGVFLYKGKPHHIKLYTEPRPEIDGGKRMYELDSLGAIFLQESPWAGNYFRLHTTNDDTEAPRSRWRPASEGISGVLAVFF